MTKPQNLNAFQVRNFLSDLDTTDCYTVLFEKIQNYEQRKSRNWMNNENTKRCRLPSTLELHLHLTSQDTRLSTSTADDLQRRFIMWPYKINILERKDELPVPFLFSYLSAGHRQCPAGTRTRPATRYFFRYPTRPDSVLEIIGWQVTWNIGFYPIFQVNPKILVLPNILGIIRKRRTRPTSGALLWDWDPQKGPQGAKKVQNLPI